MKWNCTKIPEIVTAGDLVPAAAVITNAVYFKGKFLSPFDREATERRPFYLANGEKKQVAMMYKRSEGTEYRSGKRWEAAALQYSGGEVEGFTKVSDLELLVILPKKDACPEELLKEDLSQIVRTGGQETILNLYLPRFTLDFESRLMRSLGELGMGIAFELPGADFSRIGTHPFYIADVFHKTRLEVDEEGSVAAAVTSAVQCLSALRPLEPERRTLVFDRPFVVALRDVVTRAILFVGVVYEP